MAIIEVDLGSSDQTISTSNANDGDVLNITALGSHTLTVDGVEVTVGEIAGVQVQAKPIFTATGGANLTVDQGLLNVGALNSFTYNIEDNSHITLDGSAITALTGLNSYNVNFTGSQVGSFTYDEPSISIASGLTFNVEGMEAGDHLNLGEQTWSLHEPLDTSGWPWEWAPMPAYRDGKLHLESSAGLLKTKVFAEIEMTQAQYDEFKADPDSFLSGGTFTQVCFAAGTLIATPTGEVVVEDLSIGDMILTASGKQVPVKWIGRQTVGSMTSAEHLPVRIRQDALAPNTPNKDLVLTAAHALIIDGLAINAGALVNNSTIDYVPQSELPETAVYYHIETDNHDVILANGTEAETYVDYITRQAFDNYDEYVELYGIETRIVEMPQPRISTRRHVPQVVRERLGIEDTTPVSRVA